MWSFIMENNKEAGSLNRYQVSTKEVEILEGIKLCDQLKGNWIEWEK